jgi:hypothetical protein
VVRGGVEEWLGGEVDMVVDRATYDGALAEGNIVSGKFLPSGHIIDLPTSLVQ